MDKIKFEEFHKDCIFSDDFTIKLFGGKKDQRALITCEVLDDGKKYYSEGLFEFDSKGLIDLSKIPPISGTYKGIDSKGLFGSIPDDFSNKSTNDTPIVLRAYVKDKLECEYKTKIKYVKPGVKVSEVNDKNKQLYGTLFTPSGKSFKRCFLCIPGSSGVRAHIAAAIISAKGYPALAISYFGEKTLPKKCIKVPIEIVSNAKKYMQKMFDVQEVGIISCSKGAELALFSATFEKFNPIVLVSPSSHVFQGLGDYSSPKCSWTVKGQEVPFLLNKNGIFRYLNLMFTVFRKKPNNFNQMYNKALDKDSKKNKIRKEQSRIKVEKINSDVLILAGSEDNVWPAAKMSNEIERNLKGKCKKVVYEGAGHLTFRFQPGMPVHDIVGDKVQLTLGGDSIINQKTNTAMWNEILTFIKKYKK